MPKKHSKTEKGIALITVLLVVALVTILVVSMTTDQQIDIQRTSHLINHDQAYLYLLGGESWAKRILLQDLNYSSIDSLSELWAQVLPPISIPGGVLQGKIEDLQGCFNLNNLVISGQVNPKEVEYFTYLLNVLQLPTFLAQTVVDWIDSDLAPQLPDGAEDAVYLLKKPAYRAANRLFTNTSELKLVAGFDEKIYRILASFVCTLPPQTPINVNTAPATILLSLAPKLTESDIEKLLADRQKQPFESVQAFVAHEIFSGLDIEVARLSVSSHYFLYTAYAQVDESQWRLSSTLQRSPLVVKVLTRSQE